MFNTNAVFAVPTVDGRKRAQVAYPADRDWCDRVRRHPSVRHHLGRKKTEIEPVNTRAFDLELFNRIRREGDEFDEYEASAAIDLLDKQRILGCDREGDRYRVRLRVAGAATEHVVRVPSQRDIDVYFSASGKTQFDGRNSATRSFLEPAGELYDRLVIAEQTQGYAEGSRVPVNHKAAVVSEVCLSLIEAANEDDADPEE